MSAAKTKAPKTEILTVKLNIRLYDLDAEEEINLNDVNKHSEYGTTYLNDVVIWMNNQFGLDDSQGTYYADYWKCLQKSGVKFRTHIHFINYNKDGAVLGAKYKYIVDGSCGYLGTKEEGISMFDVPQKEVKLLDGRMYSLVIKASEIIKKTKAQKDQQKAQKKQAAEKKQAQKLQAAEKKKAQKQAAEALKKAKKQAAEAAKAQNKQTKKISK